MKKGNAMLAGILAMLAVITSVGLVAVYKPKPNWYKKPIQKAPAGRFEYIEAVTEQPMTDDMELQELETELQDLEETPKDIVDEEVEEVEIDESLDEPTTKKRMEITAAAVKRYRFLFRLYCLSAKPGTFS